MDAEKRVNDQIQTHGEEMREEMGCIGDIYTSLRHEGLVNMLRHGVPMQHVTVSLVKVGAGQPYTRLIPNSGRDTCHIRGAFTGEQNHDSPLVLVSSMTTYGVQLSTP